MCLGLSFPATPKHRHISSLLGQDVWGKESTEFAPSFPYQYNATYIPQQSRNPSIPNYRIAL